MEPGKLIGKRIATISQPPKATGGITQPFTVFAVTTPYRHTVRTRLNEVDMQGRVFNAHWMTYFDEATVDSQLVCTATNTYVNLDASTGKSSPLSTDLRARLEGMKGDADDK